MATYEDARSCGGKIVTKKRRRFNPYDRPPPPPQPPETTNSNWFSGVIVPASRKIASGAAKIISSVFDSDDSSSSSSSTASSEEDDAYEGNDHDISLYGVDELNPETGTSSKDLLSVDKSERKHVIEQLLTQETFSREECERFVKIINSRVVEQSTIENWENVVPSDKPVDTIGSDSLDLCDKAVMEARNWIKEQKHGQSPVSEFGTSGVYSNRLLHIESKVASPVDMAKLYMNARPPWASPSPEHVELRSPLLMMTPLTRDKRSDSCSPSKRRSFLASGSWNIQDELRRVRSKATETMLQTISSPKVDPSTGTSQKYVVADGIVTRIGDTVNESNSPTGAKPVDPSAELTAGASGKLGSSAFENGQDDLENEDSLPEQANHVPQQKQDPKAIQMEDDYVDPKSNHSDRPDHTAEHHAALNLSSANGSNEKDVQEYAATQNANGLPSSQSSLSAGGIRNKRVEGKDNGALVEEFFSEASVEVPIAYESGSQNSHEELSQEQNQPVGTIDLAGKLDGIPEKQLRKNPSRMSKRGRGRGKKMG